MMNRPSLIILLAVLMAVSGAEYYVYHLNQ